MKNLFYLCILFLFFTTAFAQLSIEVIDEQPSNSNMFGLRIRVNNVSGQTYDNVFLKYYLKKNVSENWVLDPYYTENWNVSIVEQNGENVVVGVTIPHLGKGFSPNESGISVGIHRSDWQAMNKSSEKGFPLGTNFVSAISYDMYQGSSLLAGTSASDPAQNIYNLRFVGVQPNGSYSNAAWIEIENYGTSMVNLKDVYLKWPSADGVESRNIGNFDLKAGGRIRLCLADNPGCPSDDITALMPLMQMGDVGEFVLGVGSKILDYLTWGVTERVFAEEVRDANVHYSPIRYDLNNVDEYWHLVSYGTFYKLIDKKWCSFNESEDIQVSTAPIPVPYSKQEVFFLEEGSEREMVRFAWHPVEDAVGYNITIRRGDGSVVAEEFCYQPVFDIELDAGEYEWRITTILENDVYVVNDAWSAYHEGWNRRSVVAANGVSDVHLLQVPAYGVHKDTRMLVLNWGDHIVFPAISWDHPDEFVFNNGVASVTHNRGIEGNGNILYGEVSWRCWAVGAQMLNAFYGGNLTQDEIKFYGKTKGDAVTVQGRTFSRPERDKIIGPFGLWSAGAGNRGEAKRVLMWALQLEEADIDEWMAPTLWNLSSIPEEMIKGYIDEGRPMYVGNDHHVMVLDGYRKMYMGNSEPESFQIHLVNLYNGGETGWFDNNSSMAQLWLAYIPKIPRNPKMTDPLVHMDSDDDGIVDFDEEERFHTSSYMKDSDGDGIEDKEEIRAYTLKEPYLKRVEVDGVLPRLYHIGDVEDDPNEVFNIIRTEIYADIDNNGIRAELDNGSGVVPSQVDVAEWDAPTGVAIYAFDNLNISDGAQCFGSWHGYCKVVSESNSSYYAVSIGANSVFGDIESKGGVQIRQGAHVVGDVSVYSQPVAELLPEISQGADVTGTVSSLNVGAWPYVVSDNQIHSLTEKSLWNDMVVRAGQTVTIDHDVNLKSLKVEAGGSLKLGACEIKVGDIILDQGSKLNFIAPGQKTVIYADGLLVWKADIENTDLRTVAKGFKLIEYASGYIHIEGDWAGTLHARWANLTIGQVKKMMFGRFVAETVNVGPGLMLYRVDFDPISYANMV